MMFLDGIVSKDDVEVHFVIKNKNISIKPDYVHHKSGLSMITPNIEKMNITSFTEVGG